MDPLPNNYGSKPLSYNRGIPQAGTGAGSAVVTFMNAVYAWMCVGLGITAAVAWMVSSNENLIHSVLSRGTFMVLILMELGLVVAISAAIYKINTAVATLLFCLYAALNGLTLSVIFLVYAP